MADPLAPSWTDVITAVATLLTVGVALYAAYLSRRQLMTFEASQRALAGIEAAKTWNDGEMSRCRALVLERTNDLTDERIRDPGALKTLQDWPAVRIAVRNILNHLDVVSIGVRTGAYDAEAMYSLYGNIIVDYYAYFEPLIQDMRGPDLARGRRGWVLLYDLQWVAKAWHPLFRGGTDHATLLRSRMPARALRDAAQRSRRRTKTRL